MKLTKDYSCISNEDVQNILDSVYAKKIITNMRSSFQSIERDDFDACLNMAVVKVAKFMKRHNSDLLAKKETLLTRFLKNELIAIINHNRAKKRGNGKTNADFSCMISKTVNIDNVLDVQQVLQKISCESAYLLVEKHLKNKTLEEIGRSLGCTRENVRQSLDRAYAEFRDKYDA